MVLFMTATLLFEFKIKIPKPGLRVVEQQRKLHKAEEVGWGGLAGQEVS